MTVTKVTSRYAYGHLDRILEPSPFRVEPRCPIARTCGGCQIQALDYAKQLSFKQKKVRENLIRIGGFAPEKIDAVMHSIVGMEEPWHYRNKEQVPVQQGKYGPVTGFYASHSHTVIPMTDCCIGSPKNKQILETVLSWMQAYNVPAYDEETGKGLIRHILNNGVNARGVRNVTIAGTRVDYGAAHAAEYGHERFGRDFSGDPLIPSWDDGTRLVLVGHSFGGATARLFSELLANGDEAERAATDPSELSPLFVGGMAERIHTIAALASPLNGTTAYDLYEDSDFTPGAVKVPLWTRVTAKIMTAFLKTEPDGRDPRDYAAYDMHVDHALELNGRISTLPHVYYLSVPCTTTVAVPDGTHVAKRWTEPLFTQRAFQICAYSGKTAGGVEIDTSWCENDGLVNTISEKAPLGAPSKPFDRKEIEAGMWNVLPTLEADHMWLQGGLMRKHDIRDFYTRLIKMIDALA